MESKVLLILITAVTIFLLEGVIPHYPGRTGRAVHARPHVLTVLLNALLSALLFTGLTGWATAWAGSHHFGLLHVAAIPAPVGLAASFILFDIWMYFWHMANHRIPLLWLFHRAHHSDTAMDTTTAFRFHPGELLLFTLARVPIIILLGVDFHHVLLFETVLNISTLFHHSNLHVPAKWDRLIRTIIVSPDMHRVHHSITPSEFNSNYTSILTFWDRIFGSFRMREDTHTVTLGLKGFREEKWQGFWGFLITPFTKG
jgi:sterol desaturase/sphingolipid hydroxylase (fatty acid hydroxylase superfamily)